MFEKASESAIALIKPLIDKINIVLANLFPDGEIYLVILASGLIAYYIKNKYNWGKIAFGLAVLVLYGFFSWLGLGK